MFNPKGLSGPVFFFFEGGRWKNFTTKLATEIDIKAIFLYISYKMYKVERDSNPFNLH